MPPGVVEAVEACAWSTHGTTASSVLTRNVGKRADGVDLTVLPDNHVFQRRSSRTALAEMLSRLLPSVE
jgi:hypothetical protein